MDHRTLSILGAVALVTSLASVVPMTDAIVGPPLGAGLVGLETVVTGLDQPLYLTHAGDGSGRLFVVEKEGTVRVLDDGVLLAGNWLDVRDRVSTNSERGLLGLAFHPDFETNGLVIVSYTNRAGDSVLVRHVLADPATDAPGTAAGETLLVVDQPFSNHNGGGAVFGPDGHLYFGLGDGGSAGDPHANGQDPHTLLGAILRLDVDVPSGYAVPADNPFVGGGGAAEIWAWGLRNPWRFSFDRVNGDLWIADVGQDLMEEVNRQPASSSGGENYGWNQWEGVLPFRANADAAGKTFPVMVYGHTGAHCSVTGGYVYRGDAIPALEGAYVFGDLCAGTVFAGIGTTGGWVPITLLQSTATIASFGEDEAGELYLVNYGGSIHKFVPSA